MKYYFFFFCFSVFSFSQESQLSLKQGTSKNRTILVSKFTELKLTSGVVAKIILGDKYKIVLSGDNKNVIYKQKDSLLELKFSKALFSSNIEKKDTILIYYKNTIDAIFIGKNSFLTTDKEIKQTSIDITVASNGIAKLKFDTEKINFRLIKGGTAFLEGKTTVLNLFSGTSSVCEAEKLIADQVDVTASKTGIAYVYGKKLVEASVFVKGIIRIHGNPKKIVKKTTLGGQIFIME